jgi:hypothetical protein
MSMPAPPPALPPWPDLFNEGLDDLAATLATITGLRVVMNPKDINPPCVFLNAPTIDAFNYNIARIGEPGTEYVPEEGVNLDALIEGGFIKASKTSKAVEKDTD